VVTHTKFTDMPVDILWLHIRSLQTCLWIFCGFIYDAYRHAFEYSVVTQYEVYRHACGYSVVTYTKFTDMTVDIHWLHIYETPENACRDCVVAWKLFYRTLTDSVGRMNVKCAR